MAPVSDSGSEADAADELDEAEEDYEDDCEEYAEEYVSDDDADSISSSSSSISQPLRGSFPSIPTRSSVANSGSSSSSSRTASPSQLGDAAGDDAASSDDFLSCTRKSFAEQPEATEELAEEAATIAEEAVAASSPGDVIATPPLAAASTALAAPVALPALAASPSSASAAPLSAMDLDLRPSLDDHVRNDEEKASFPLGRYTITNPASVTIDIDRESDLVTWLEANASVMVTEVIRSNREHRMRARIAEPAGWISICDLLGEMFWARPATVVPMGDADQATACSGSDRTHEQEESDILDEEKSEPQVAVCTTPSEEATEPEPIDAPGRYCLIRPASITIQIERASDLVEWLEVGVYIQVEEVVIHEEEQRIRARISSPIRGWISLAHLDLSQRWAERLPDEVAMGDTAPDEAADLAATAQGPAGEMSKLPSDPATQLGRSSTPIHYLPEAATEEQEPGRHSGREKSAQQPSLSADSSELQLTDDQPDSGRLEDQDSEEYHVKLPIPEALLSPVKFADTREDSEGLSPAGSSRSKGVSAKDQFFSLMATLGNGNIAAAWKRIFCNREGPLGIAWVDFDSGLDELEFYGSRGDLWAELSGIDSLVEYLAWDQVLDETSACWIRALGDWCRSRCGGLLPTWELLGGSAEGPPLPAQTLLQGFRDCGLFDTPEIPFGLASEDEFRRLVLPVINLSGTGSVLPEAMLFLERNTKLRRRLRLELEHARERAADLPAAYSGHRPRVPRCGGVNTVPGRSEASSLLTRAAHEGLSVEPPCAVPGRPPRELQLRGKQQQRSSRHPDVGVGVGVSDRRAAGALGGLRHCRPSLAPLLEEGPSGAPSRSSSAPASPSACSRPTLMEETLPPDEGWLDRSSKARAALPGVPTAPRAPAVDPQPPSASRSHQAPQPSPGDYLGARPLPAALRRATSSSVPRRGASVAMLAPSTNRRPTQAFGSKAPLHNLPSLGPPPAVAPHSVLPRLSSMPELRPRCSPPPSSAGASVSPSDIPSDVASAAAAAGRHRKQTKQVYGHKMESCIPEGQAHLQWHNPKQRAARNKDDRHAKLPVVHGEDFLRRGACQDLFDRYCHTQN